MAGEANALQRRPRSEVVSNAVGVTPAGVAVPLLREHLWLLIVPARAHIGWILILNFDSAVIFIAVFRESYYSNKGVADGKSRIGNGASGFRDQRIENSAARRSGRSSADQRRDREALRWHDATARKS